MGKGSNLKSLLLVEVFAEVAEVNTEEFLPALAKHCEGKAEGKRVFIKLPQHFICRGKKC